ncbi:MAG: hypothetical protein PUH15_02810, partial [Dialister sp.]|nr:hypothetical protein [Dialister sp.]
MPLGRDRKNCGAYAPFPWVARLAGSQLSVKFYSVGEFSRNNKRGKPPLEWKCYNFRAEIKQRKGFPHGYYNKN